MSPDARMMTFGVFGAIFAYLTFRLWLWWRNKAVVLSIDSIRRVQSNTCAYCGAVITRANDSGWCAFVGPALVQKTCQTCWDAHQGAETAQVASLPKAER